MPTFENYKQQLATFFSKAKGDTKLFAKDILNSLKTHDDKISFVNAMEYWHYEIRNQQNKIDQLRQQLQLFQQIKDLPDLTKFTHKHVESIVEIQIIVSSKIKTFINRQDKRYAELKILSDLCLIIITLCKKSGNHTQLNLSDLVSNQITEKDVEKHCNITLFNIESLQKVKLKDVYKTFKNTVGDLLEKKKISQLAEAQITERELNRNGHRRLTEELNNILSIEKNNSWKHKLLYDKQLDLLKLGGSKGLEIETDFSPQANFTTERFRHEYHEPIAACLTMGNTFFGHSYTPGKSKSLCLDASYITQDISVISDGLGHFSSPLDNQKVHWAAFWTAKQAFRRTYEFKDPQQLFDHFKTLLEKVSDDIRNLGVRAEDFGTASCVITKTFKSAQNEAVVMCGSVGDGMAFAWDGKTIHQLCVPRHYVRGIEINPLSVTDKLTLSTIDRSLLKLKSTSVIFTMTDGIWQMLPHRRSPLLQNEEVKMSYYEYRLDIDELTRLFVTFQSNNSAATVNDYRVWLQRLVQDNLEKKRVNLIGLQKIFNAAGQLPINSSIQTYLDSIKENKESIKNMCLMALSDLDYIIDDFNKIAIGEFNNKIQHYQIGDDTALSVQQIKLTT